MLRKLVHAHRSLTGHGPASLSRVSADEVRMNLPEYAAGRGSEVVAREAFDLTYDVVYPRARDLDADLVYDTIGLVRPDGAASFEVNLRELRDAGFTPRVLLADCPLAVCIDRCTKRALQDGRLVDPGVQYA